ncbi:MAG: CobW family GTP-binding protein [Geminicoccales bacterium]
MADYGALIPVNLITGFLGSGKTTLLNRLLRSPRLAGSAVLVNEFGEVGLDHLLLETLDAETVILQSGCLCCTIRGDLAEAMRDLFSRRERGVVPAFDRLTIETTGLADPAPIVSTLIAEPVLRHHFRLSNIVATVDAVNGLTHLAEHPESVKQAAIADRLVITKTDIADPKEAARLRTELRRLNPSAPILDLAGQGVDPDDLMASDVYDPATKSLEVQRWVAEEALHAAASGDAHGHDPNRHGRGIRAFCLTFERPLDWSAFGLWLTMLLHAHGHNVLRVKGLLNVLDVDSPVVIHGVQHVVHPPAHLDRWPSADRRSRLVLIVRGLDPPALERSLAAFNRLANPIVQAA